MIVPTWQVSKVSILTASSHDLNLSSSLSWLSAWLAVEQNGNTDMAGSNMTVSRLTKSSTIMNVSGGAS